MSALNPFYIETIYKDSDCKLVGNNDTETDIIEAPPDGHGRKKRIQENWSKDVGMSQQLGF